MYKLTKHLFSDVFNHFFIANTQIPCHNTRQSDHHVAYKNLMSRENRISYKGKKVWKSPRSEMEENQVF